MTFTLVGLRPTDGSLIRYPQPLPKATGKRVESIVDTFSRECGGPICLVDDTCAAARRMSPMEFAMRFFENHVPSQAS